MPLTERLLVRWQSSVFRRVRAHHPGSGHVHVTFSLCAGLCGNLPSL